jgi:hypothetical protein
MKHELKPIDQPYQSDIAALLKRYPTGRDGYILKLFRLFANSRRFLAGKGVVNLLDNESPLALRVREIIILRTTANKNCEYEWGIHVTAFTKAANLSIEQVEASRLLPSTAKCWDAKEQRLLACIDDLCLAGSISAVNLAGFQKDWNLDQQLEIFALCGNYHTVSFVANSCRLTSEDGMARFPV